MIMFEQYSRGSVCQNTVKDQQIICSMLNVLTLFEQFSINFFHLNQWVHDSLNTIKESNPKPDYKNSFSKFFVHTQEDRPKKSKQCRLKY